MSAMSGLTTSVVPPRASPGAGSRAIAGAGGHDQQHVLPSAAARQTASWLGRKEGKPNASLQKVLEVGGRQRAG